MGIVYIPYALLSISIFCQFPPHAFVMLRSSARLAQEWRTSWRNQRLWAVFNAVTYIVGLRSPKGFVISADSQETTGEEIHYVQKIATEYAGPWEIAVGGAGRGELVDGFVQQAVEAIRQTNPKNLTELKEVLRQSLAQFLTSP
jgi:hypothetical protein